MSVASGAEISNTEEVTCEKCKRSVVWQNEQVDFTANAQYNDPPQTWEDFLALECTPMIPQTRIIEIYDKVYGAFASTRIGLKDYSGALIT